MDRPEGSGSYARGYREGIRTALDAAAQRAEEIGRPLTADELRRIGAEFDHLARRAAAAVAR